MALDAGEIARADQAMSSNSASALRAIMSLRTTPADASVSSVSAIPLADGFSVEGVYQQQDRLLSLTASNWWDTFGD